VTVSASFIDLGEPLGGLSCKLKSELSSLSLRDLLLLEVGMGEQPSVGITSCVCCRLELFEVGLLVLLLLGVLSVLSREVRRAPGVTCVRVP
jgi:hypothetical protein